MQLSYKDVQRLIRVAMLALCLRPRTSRHSVGWHSQWERHSRHQQMHNSILWLRPCLAQDSLWGQTSLLRRLHFESTTLMIASVKQRVDGEAADKADSVRKIPIAEKRHRMEQQARRLTGINITGEMEPSHSCWISPTTSWRMVHSSGSHRAGARRGLMRCSLQ